MDPLFWSRASGNPSGTAALSDTESSGVGVFTRAAPVCAAQIGVNLRQSSGTVPLGADAGCTVIQSGANRAAILFTLVKFPLPVSVKSELGRGAISNLRCQWLPLT